MFLNVSGNKRRWGVSGRVGKGENGQKAGTLSERVSELH